MSHKVLLADDSLTIQKVIKITLANQPFEITDCSSDDELFKKLPEIKPKIVFLDFNLSDKYTGYELCSKIRSMSPSTKVLLLLGTFDTVDDSAMEKCGASDKVVKPFDSNKFISICKRLVDSEEIKEEINFPEPKKEEFVVPKAEDQWQMSHTIETKTQVQEPEKPAFDVRNHLNPLDQEVSDWGMSIPSVINDQDTHEKTIDLPPVIGEVKSLDEHRNKVDTQKSESTKPDIKFPEADDLDYPTLEELEASNTPENRPPQRKSDTSSKLISIDTFNTDNLEVEHEINSVEETDVSSIEAQIRDEVEEDLWKADEFEDLKREVSAKIEEVKNNLEPAAENFDESLFRPLDENESIEWSSEEKAPSFEQQVPAANHDEIVKELRSEMESLIKKYVKEYMDDMFKQKVEKISWEVIPDLAENLIRQELSKLSNKILNDQK